MKIVIDARMLYWTGVGRYTKALLDNLEQIDHDNEYVVLVRRADWALWEPVAANFTKIEANINPYTIGEQTKLVGLLRKLRPDLVHFTAANTPLLYRGLRVVTVHDLTLVDYDTSRGHGVAKWLRGLKRLPFRLVLWNSVHGASVIISGTQYVKAELMKRYRIVGARIVPVLLSADPNVAEPVDATKYGAGADYVMYLGNFYPYKNVGSSIEAFGRIADRFPGYKFVLVGPDDYFRERLQERVRALGLARRVVFTGRIPNGEMVWLYRGARLYVNPSLSEGFGLQGLEAMAAGAPVIAARASCLPEVYANAAVYFEPHDAGDQAAKMAEVLNSPELQEELRVAGAARLKHFSWAKMAEQTLAVYQRAERRRV